MLAAPAATAGAICVDRARGTLAHMLVTDLSDPEIVLGKLAARLLPILGLVACTWPVLAICSLLGGIDPTALTLAFAIILAVALLGCTMALALSVWARKPHEVVLVVYTFWMLVLLLWPIWYALSLGEARSARRPPGASWRTRTTWRSPRTPCPAGSISGTISVSSPRRWGHPSRWRSWRSGGCGPSRAGGPTNDRKEPRLGLVGRLTRWLPGPSLDGNPVLWREWHRSRPSRWMMILVVLVGGSTGVACVVGAVTVWTNGRGRRASAAARG